MILLLLAFGISMTISAQTGNTSGDFHDDNLTALTTLANTWKDAYNAKDTAKIASLYTPDAIYCSAHVPVLVASGRDQIRDYLYGGMIGGGHVDSIIILSYDISQDLGTVFCEYNATNSGKTVNGRNLIVVKRVDGKWFFNKHITVVKD